jgi:hypothetical protein
MVAVLLVGSILTTAARASAADNRIVLVVRVDEGATATAQGLRARVTQELFARGFTVDALEPAPEPVAGDAVLLRAVREHDAALGVSVHLIAEPVRAEIRIVDRTTGKTLQRALDDAELAHEPSTVALAVAELVDASLIELRLPQTTMPAEIEPPPRLPVPDVRAPVHFHVGVAVGGLWPVRHRVPVAVASVSFAVRPTPRLAIVPEGIVPLHALRDRDAAGLVRTFPFLAGVRIDVDVLPRAAPVRLDVQAGVHALALRVEVEPALGIIARPTTVWSGAGLLGAVVRRDFGEHFHVAGGVRAIAPFERLHVRAAGRTVQDLGVLWVMAALEIAGRW